MENFKISVDVNINFSDNAKSFLTKLFSAPAAPAAPAAPGDISIEDVRALLSEKIAKHRKEIKDELTSLGAPSVTKLDKSKYPDMINFLNSLD